MKSQIQFLVVSVSLGLVAATGGVQGGTFSDDFSAGLDPSLWSVIQTTPGFYAASASQGNVQLAKTLVHNPGGAQGVYIRLNLAPFGGRITNDFSTQIDFLNVVVPGPGLDQIEFHTYYEDGSIYYTVYDRSSGYYNAHVWDGGAVQGMIAVPGDSGRFSISRIGATVTGYFNGMPLYSETRSSPLTGIDFVLQNNNGSDDAISGTFDNFSLTSASVSPPSVRSGIFYFVSLTNQANFTWASPDTVPGEPTATRLPGAPVGITKLGGVPFDIASNAAGKQAWHADIAANGGSGPVSITNNVSIYGATSVYSLINTWEGQPGPNAYAWFVFTGSGGAIYTNYLTGGADIRDYNGANWENNIDGTKTLNVFECPNDNWGSPGRLDMQQIPLPPEFATQTLVSIQLVDNGGANFQRVVLDGLTVQTATSSLLTIEGSGSQVRVSWPAATGGTLQTNRNLAFSNWAAYGGSAINLDGTNIVTIAPPLGTMFFRLSQ